MKAAVIFHKADYDGKFSGDICRYFLEKNGYEVDMYPYDYGEPNPLAEPKPYPYDVIYVVDVSLDEVLDGVNERVVWIDHHKTAIDKYNSSIEGLRIDGVAACRLCWQWFLSSDELSNKQAYIDRQVSEPLIVRLAGEYDVWDKRDPRADPLQLGMRTRDFNLYELLRNSNESDLFVGELVVNNLVGIGKVIQEYKNKTNKETVAAYGRHIRFSGINFLVMNWPQFSSLNFEGNITDETEALMSWVWTGDKVKVSLYGCANSKPDLDLSAIAKNFGGGGHRTACGFQLDLSDMQEILLGDMMKEAINV